MINVLIDQAGITALFHYLVPELPVAMIAEQVKTFTDNGTLPSVRLGETTMYRPGDVQQILGGRKP